MNETVSLQGKWKKGATAERGSFETTSTRATVRVRKPDGTTGPRKLARYRLRSQIGRGGAGVVYLADDPHLERPVALKFVHHGGMNSDGGGGPRLLAEAQALAQVRHANVVSIYDVGEYGPDDAAALFEEEYLGAKIPATGLFLVMEYVDGVTLREWWRARRRTWRETLEVLLDAARGLAAAHAQGVIHRDLKPNNVLVSAEGVRVVDFGLALAGTSLADIELAGTPSYMAPEQHTGEATDARTDQYGFCVTAFEALTGRRPFAGGDPEQLLRLKQRPDAIAIPRDHPAAARVWRALRRGLSADPNERFASMHALIDALSGRRVRQIRRMAAASVLVLLAAGGGASLLVPRASICESQSQAVDRVWSASVVSSLGSALTPRIEPVEWSRLHDELDQRAMTWKAAYLRACEHTTAASPTAPMPTAALDCLQRQLGEFEGLTTLLAEGRPHVSVRARELAASLAPVDACAQPSLGRPSMPTAGEERVVALDLRARLDRARMLREAGDIDDAGTLIEQTLHAAERADAVTYAAALLQHGHFQKDALRPKAAEQDFREVWRRAEHLGEDGLAIDAVVSLSTATLDTPGRVVQGLDLLDIADAKIARHGGDRRRTLNSTIQRATLLHRQGSLDEALAQAEHSVALAEALYGQGAPQLAIPLGALALTQTAAGHYDACMASTRRALDIAVLHFGKAAPITAVTTQNLGAISSSLGKYRQAIVLYGEALELLRRLHGDPSEPVAMVLSNIGAAELSLGRIEAALVSSRAARDAYLHSVGPDYIGIGYTHSNLATVMRERGYMSETKAARAESIRVWTHALSADHPLLRGARIGQAVDDAIFTPSVSTFDVLSRRLLPSLDDDAIDPATRADGAFMLAVHLAKAQPARARRLLERARRLGTPRVLANIEAWERSQLQPLGVVPG